MSLYHKTSKKEAKQTKEIKNANTQEKNYNKQKKIHKLIYLVTGSSTVE